MLKVFPLQATTPEKSIRNGTAALPSLKAINKHDYKSGWKGREKINEQRLWFSGGDENTASRGWEHESGIFYNIRTSLGH